MSRRAKRNQKARDRQARALHAHPPARVVAAAKALAAAVLPAPEPIIAAAAGRPKASAGGPTSIEGRLKSRANALKHGMTAKVLLLPGEDPDEVRAKADYWRQTYRPQGAGEEALVKQLVLAERRLDRISGIELATIDDQVRDAEVHWVEEQRTRLTKLQRMLRSDRMIAMIKLQSFGAGVRWLLERWEIFEETFNQSQCWTDVETIREAISLRGLHDERVSSGFEFAHLAISCVANVKEHPALIHFLENYHDNAHASIDTANGMRRLVNSVASYITDECVSRAGVRERSVADARRTMRAWLDRQLAELRELDEHFRESDEQARANASVRATLPENTRQNRLMLRYMRAAELQMDRAMKSLIRLQNERQKAAERAAKNDLPNELAATAESPAKESAGGSYVADANPDCGFDQVTIGAPTNESTALPVGSQPLDVAARVENGV
jgi:hypothetical protein